MRIGVIVIGFVMAGCGGREAPKAPGTATVVSSQAASVSSGAPAKTDAAITIVPFKLIPTAKPDRSVDVKADGTVSVGGKTTMKFVDNELRTPEGHTVLSLAKDGTVTLHRKDNAEEIVGSLNDKDEFLPKRQESRRMWLDEKGALKLLGVPDPESGKEPLKLEGVDATNRRAAMLVTILFFTPTAPKTEPAAHPSTTATKGEAGAPATTPVASKPAK